MANTFKSTLTSSLATTLTTVYSAPTTANGITTVIGLALANKSASAVTVDVSILRGGNTFYLVKTGVVPVGGTLTVAGADQKIVLIQNDVIQALCNTAGSIDVVVSVLEIT